MMHLLNSSLSWLSSVTLPIALSAALPLYASNTVKQQFTKQTVSPKDFPTAESFFHKSGCSFTFLTAYLYNTETNHWLSASEAKQALPTVENLFYKDCNVPFSKSEIASTFNLTFPATEGLVLLYIGPMQTLFTAEVFREKYEGRYKQHLQQLQSVSHIPQYEISTPTTGLKSQF